ncbi:MAG TPA: glycosyltransferase family 39 protein [Steroidobacteraceae bacterium]|nr:glycosyltransferase family 39 protein [Steroidobacteraceae bacterium]
MFDAATRAATPIATIVSATIAEAVRALARLFRVTLPAAEETVLHWVLLGVVLCIGAFVRFWNLGGPGLHGDEETMAMAAMHIVQDGWPILPSGMFYPRGLSELYLMAASVQIFGESEWAFRLPSALAGVATIYLCYLAGRRFLRPQWNLALAATVALLPEMIEYSQTARMYVFMLACVAGSLACIFAWERSGRIGWLIGALLALILGIELHALAVTCALLFLMPGLLQGDQRKFMYGVAAVTVAMIAYLLIDGWVNSNYPVPPPEYAAQMARQVKPSGAPLHHPPFIFDVAIWSAGAVTAFLAVLLGQRVRPRLPALVATSLFVGCLIAQLAVYYHLAALLGLAGTIVAFRYRGAQPIERRYWRFVIGSAVVALVHVGLITAWPGSMIKLVGAIVGQPSVWPYVRVMQFTIGAGILVVLATAWGLWNLAFNKRVPDYWLLALLGVWIPVFFIGFYVWDLPVRYTAASLIPVLLCAFAFAQRCTDALWARLRLGLASKPIQHAAVVAVVIIAANPATTIAWMTSDGSRYPDHRGAANFIRTQNITPDDIVLAEDVLQQTYYLGRVDYWLIGRKHSWRYQQRLSNGRIQDFYTGTAVIDTGEQFQALLDRNPHRRIFVIGSGENSRDGRREMRGEEINALLKSDRFEPLFVGSDNFTRVWLAKQPVKQPPAGTQ